MITELVANMNPNLLTALLIGKIVLLSLFTSVTRFKSGKMISSEDINILTKEVGESNATLRVRNAQRNDMENCFTIILVLFLTRTTYTPLYLSIIVGCRILHGFAYLLKLQPWRGIFFMVPHMMAYRMLYNFYMETNNYSWKPFSARFQNDQFLNIIAILLIKTHVMSFLTSAFRYGNKTSHYGIVEDAQAMKQMTGADKPSGRNEQAERIQLNHMKDIYNHVAVIILCLVIRNGNLMPLAKVTDCLRFYVLARTAITLSNVLGLPHIFQMAGYFAGLYFLVPLFTKSINLNRAFTDYDLLLSSKNYMLIILILKNQIIGVLEQFYNLIRGQFDIHRNQLINPENHYNDENVRAINIQRNDGETVLTFLTLIAVLKFSVPVAVIKYFFIARMVHSLVYVLHVPQPARALSWFVNIYGIYQVLMMYF